MMANIDSHFETDEGYENYDDLYDEQVEVFKQLEEFRVSTSCTPLETTRIKYIPQHQKLCLSVSEAHQVYEAIQQDRPVYPTKISLGLDRTRQLLSETANPYVAALKRDLDSEFQEEPMSGLNES